MRIQIATMLLKWKGAEVEYRVKRIKFKEGDRKNTDGTTLLRTQRYSEAVTKMESVRVADNDKIVIQIVATTNSRLGGGPQ